MHFLLGILFLRMTTTIQISDEVWEELNKRKKKGEAFESVLRKLLKLNGKKKEK